MAPEIFATMSGSASRRCHCAVALDGRIASEAEHFASTRRGLTQDFDVAAPDAEPCQQRVHRVLRMVG